MEAELRAVRREKAKLWKKYGKHLRNGYKQHAAIVLEGIQILDRRELALMTVIENEERQLDGR